MAIGLQKAANVFQNNHLLFCILARLANLESKPKAYEEKNRKGTDSLTVAVR